MGNKQSYKWTIIACYIGYFVQATVINLVPILFVILRESYGLSYSELGALVLINFVTQVIFDVVFSKPVDKYGFRPFVVVAHGICALGLILFALTPRVFNGNIFGGFIFSTIIFSGGGGLLELVISPIIDAIPSADKATAMSLLHSFYAWGQVTIVIVTTIFLFYFGIDKWWIIMMIWAIVPVINFFIFMKVPLTQKVHESKVMKIRELIRNPIFIVAFFAIMLGAASEVSMNQWTATFMERGLLIPKVVGDMLGMCFFAIMLGIGRAIYGVYGSKVNINKVMILGSLAAALCYLVVAISPYNWVSIIACGICGIFVSLLWPGTLVVASSRLPLAGASMFALLAAAGDVGAAIGPWIVGKITDIATNNWQALSSFSINPEQLGLRIAILVAAIFPILTMIFHNILKNIKGKENINRTESVC
ncbi:Major Facilitator Superfamily [uncultured Clostridium sp.]|uniref:MFS transporter n=1 Tax=uncultured Clostridium sp. TaxID=59620 RepID=UPI000821C622|nr:MFS transporter [uncultured Clostridium sp.]SCJ93296.1 Major Facilitator Superfamily [uncultured Clostridium sp.]